MGAPSVDQCSGTQSAWPRVWGYAAWLAMLAVVFARPLARLIGYAAHHDLHSHILLVPFISAYLLYLDRRRLPAVYRCSFWGAGALGAIGIAARGATTGWSNLSLNDESALLAAAFVSFVAAGGYLFLGSRWMAAAAFPMAFLVFLAPLPDAAVDWLEKASMYASAEAAALFFDVSGTAVARQGTVFELPGIVLRVAQECSGIRSSWVLFIAGLVASHCFLRTRWRKLVLVAFVIPLGIARNGFRILVIGLLCVHVGPEIIHSPIHRSGGPLFFALSLIPLFLLMWWLRRQERRLPAPAEDV